MHAFQKARSGPGDEWETPDWLFNACVRRFGEFNLDVCATEANTKCRQFFSPADDSLVLPWYGRCWMNPPYSAPERWISKAIEETWGASTRLCEVVALLPSDTSTRWFHEAVFPHALSISFLRPRVRFVGAAGSPPFGSMVVLFGSRWRQTASPMVRVWDLREEAKA